MHTHQHFSRRLLMAGGAALGAGLLLPGQVLAGPKPSGGPRETPNFNTIGGVQFHTGGPIAFGHDASSITDFNGFLGASDVRGNGLATYPNGTSETLLYDTDMRFMSGVFRDTNGNTQQGTFAFV
jgi:hypothetical protein